VRAVEAHRLFIEAANLTLDDLPHLFGQAVRGEKLTNTEEQMKRWNDAGLGHISKETYAAFGEAFAILLSSSCYPDGSPTYADVVGKVYMELVGSSSWNKGEFYTPQSIAQMVAQMIINPVGLEQEFFRRCREVYESDPLLESLILAAGFSMKAFDYDESPEKDEAVGYAVNFFAERIWPLIRPKIEPIRICDPCVGSGVMLLAAAEVIPRWLIDIGFVQFFGQDISNIAVGMCRLNMKLYGLTPLGIKPADMLKAWELAALPSPHKKIYTDYQADLEQGREDAQERAAERLAEARAVQMGLFGEAQVEIPTSKSRARAQGEKSARKKQALSPSLFSDSEDYQ
jgi:hypothetical protein